METRNLIDERFFAKPFIRTLGYREFLTSLSLALLLLALYSVIDYYSNEDWIENNYSLLWYGLLGVTIPANHIYRVEHGRANNFIGRNFHDYIFLVLFITLYQLQSLCKTAVISLKPDR